MWDRNRRRRGTAIRLCYVLVTIALIGSFLAGNHVAAADQFITTLPPELTAARAGTSDVELLAGSEIDWFTTKFYNTITFSRWTLPPGTETDVHFSGLSLTLAEAGAVTLVDSVGPDNETIEAPNSLLLKKHDPRKFSMRNDGDRCASVLVLQVNAAESFAAGGGGTWTDEDGPRLAAEAPCGTDAEEHVFISWDQPFRASSKDLETFADGPLFIFIARKTMQPDTWLGIHGYTGPVGMYVEQGQLWLPADGSEVLLGAGGLTLIPTGRTISESTGFGQPTTALIFGVVSATSQPGPELLAPHETSRLNVARNSYQSPTFPFSLTWDYSWVVSSYKDDGIGLTNGRSDASFRVSPATGDAKTCVAETADGALNAARDQDYVIAQDNSGNDLAGPNPDGRGYYAYYRSATQARIHYFECIPFDNDASMLAMHFTVDFNDYAPEVDALNNLRSRISMPN